MSNAGTVSVELSREDHELLHKALAWSASHLDSRAQNTTGRNVSAQRETAAQMRTLLARLGRERAMASGVAERLWEHPAIAGKHIVSRTREPGGAHRGSWEVATCQCTWKYRAETNKRGAFLCNEAVEKHWRGMIAAGESEAA